MVVGINRYGQKNSEAENLLREGTAHCEEETTVLECIAAHATANKEAMMVVGRARCNKACREIELLSTSSTPMQLCSSSPTTTDDRNTLLCQRICCIDLERASGIRVYTDNCIACSARIFEAGNKLAGVRQRPVLHCNLEGLEVIKLLPKRTALMTGMGGGDGERDMVIEIDRWQRD